MYFKFTVVCGWNQKIINNVRDKVYAQILQFEEHQVNRAGMTVVYELKSNDFFKYLFIFNFFQVTLWIWNIL